MRLWTALSVSHVSLTFRRGDRLFKPTVQTRCRQWPATISPAHCADRNGRFAYGKLVITRELEVLPLKAHSAMSNAFNMIGNEEAFRKRLKPEVSTIVPTAFWPSVSSYQVVRRSSTSETNHILNMRRTPSLTLASSFGRSSMTSEVALQYSHPYDNLDCRARTSLRMHTFAYRGLVTQVPRGVL